MKTLRGSKNAAYIDVTLRLICNWGTDSILNAILWLTTINQLIVIEVVA